MERPDPFSLFDTWFVEARTTEINDSNAMALATTGADGQPSVRMVLLKGHGLHIAWAITIHLTMAHFIHCVTHRCMHIMVQPFLLLLSHSIYHQEYQWHLHGLVVEAFFRFS